MPKPVLGSQILGDTFENLKSQSGDVAQGLKDLVTGDAPAADFKGDSGIEQLAGQQDPKTQAQQSAAAGLTPQQLAQKRIDEQRQREFHLEQIKSWDEHYRQVKNEEAQKGAEAEKQKQAEEEQEIIQLREEQAKAQTLQGSDKPKQGRGTAFLPPSAKQSMGTGELSKTPTN